MKRGAVVVAALAAAAAIVATSAFADGSLAIAFSPGGKIASQIQADMTVFVTCVPLDQQTDGSVVVSLTQQSGSKIAEGIGSAAIACDGQSHSYVVAVVATSGRWHNGSATATATGAANGFHSTTVCGTDSEGDIVCTTNEAPGRDSGSAGGAAVTLTTD
jgi:hypothetical protein